MTGTFDPVGKAVAMATLELMRRWEANHPAIQRLILEKAAWKTRS